MNTIRNTTAVALALIPTLAGALCGNALLDEGERCDDGNTFSGDGCSALCQVEAGYDCTDPVEPGDLTALADGSFELPAVVSPWTTSVVSPLCRTSMCGQGSGTGAADGNGWSWFGGRAQAGSQHVEQAVFMPGGAILRFSVENPSCDSANDVARVLIDGSEVWFADGADPTCATVGYRQVEVDLATAPGGPYDDNAMHTLRIEATLTATNGGVSSFFFDEVVVDIGETTPAAGQCVQQREVCMLEEFEGLAGNFAPVNWSVFETGAVAAAWGTTDDGVCASVNGAPGNFTGGAGDAACIDADAIAATAGSDQVDAYLCTPAGDFTTVTGAGLEFRLNYQVVSDPDSGDILQVLAGDVPPSPATIAGFTPVYSSDGVNAGQVGLSPGEDVSLDLSALDGSPAAYVCFRYGARDDWYAQVDDVAITATDCAQADTDGDGIADDSDNCTLVANPAQIDSNGDGFGNVCDADIAGPAGIDDCFVNFHDLQALKAAFFSTSAAPNWNPHADLTGPAGAPDGVVNFPDLLQVAAQLFGPPGPSAQAQCGSGP